MSIHDNYMREIILIYKLHFIHHKKRDDMFDNIYFFNFPFVITYLKHFPQIYIKSEQKSPKVQRKLRAINKQKKSLSKHFFFGFPRPLSESLSLIKESFGFGVSYNISTQMINKSGRTKHQEGGDDGGCDDGDDCWTLSQSST